MVESRCPFSNALVRGEGAPSDSLCRFLLWDNATAMVLLVGVGGGILASNRAAQRAYGYSDAEFRTLNLSHLSLEPVDACMAGQLAETGSGSVFETTHRRKDGTCLPVEISCAARTIGGVKVALHFMVDITRRKRLEGTHALLRQVDSRILQHLPLAETLQSLCEHAAQLFGLDLVWIGLKRDHGVVANLATGGPAAAFLQDLPLRWDESPYGMGPVGTAMRTGQPVFRDARSPGPAEWVERTRAFGLAAALAIPLNVEGTTLGALTFYAASPDAFDPPTREMLTSFADQVALSLQAARQHDEIALQRRTLEAAANAVVITDDHGRILWVNPAFTLLTGYSAEEAVGQTPRLLKSGRHTGQFYHHMWKAILSGDGHWHGELCNRRKDGSVYIDEQTITAVRDGSGAISHFICIKQDVTERRHREEQLRHLATHDPVTDLFNRRALKEHLQRLINRAAGGVGGAILLLDLDNFKLVNDTMGHAVGDQFLVSVAQLLRRYLRPSDTLARLGGDEFAILLEGVTLEQARLVAERIRWGVADFRFEAQGKLLSVGVSIGVAPIDGSLEADDVTAKADSALYEAKELGKNRSVVFGANNRGRELMEAAQWASRVRDAVAGDLLFLELQPVTNLTTGQPEHSEVLLRLRAENGRTILPGEFIPPAEQYGLMPQLDRWVVDQVLRLLQKDPTLSLFVNVSGQSMGDEAFLVCMEERLRDQPEVAARLTFEITETAAIRDILGAEDWMWRLKELGCKFALDDFGAGFSSFAYLRSLPVDYVKVDGSLVRSITREPTDRALVQAIVTVSHALGKPVIAEWVESREVADALRSMGVLYGQGYYLGMPAAV
ncbi:MAG TPA: EAL domain-containing protein [Symbiobacteriaceae bacterium]|nr:EAL domain-containing protein [Symbiobacteriaceae bacterium]